MRPDLLMHVAAGAVGILSGFVALAAAKGSRLHRRSGRVFVYAMLPMALLGAAIAAVRGAAPAVNVPMGLLTAYLVVTGLTTVRPPAAGSRRLDLALALLVLAVCASLLGFGAEALASPGGRRQGIPASALLVFGSVALLAGVGDVRLIRSGGVHSIRGARRLARHLWRMCFALLIAAFSFFLGQAKVIPKPIRILPLLVLPPLVVLVALAYWLWRVRGRRSIRRGGGARGPEPAGGGARDDGTPGPGAGSPLGGGWAPAAATGSASSSP